MGITTIQLGAAAWGFRETPLEGQLEMSCALGLPLLELGIAGHERDRLQVDAGEADIAEVKALFALHCMELTHASTGNDFTQADEAGCRASLENVKAVTGIAAKLGVRYLRVFAGFSPADEVTGQRWNRMVSCLNEATEEAQRLGVTLAVETHGGVKGVPGGIAHFASVSTRPELLERWLAEVSPSLRVLFDPANLGAVGMNEAEIIALYEKLSPRVCTLHLKDFKRVGPGALQPCACGEGQLDWNVLWPVFRDFKGAGFIEYELPEDIERGLRRSLAAFGV